MPYSMYEMIDGTIIKPLKHGQDLLEDSHKENMKNQLYTLWQECFGDSSSYIDFYFRYKIPYNQVLSVYDNTKLISMLHLNPYVIRMGSKKINSKYIVGVATDSTYRRQGIMRDVMEVALKQMYEKRVPFTYLMPAKEEIYLPFDFETVYAQELWNLLLLDTSLTNAIIDNIDICILERNSSNQIDELVEYSNGLLRENYHIYVERDAFYFIRLIEEMRNCKGNVVVFRKDSKIIGYGSYMLETTFHITELLYNIDKKEQVVSAMNVIYKNSGLSIDSESTFVPSIMTRIVDFRTFTESLNSHQNVKLFIEVKDSIIHDNEGRYELEFNSSGCIVKGTTMDSEVVGDIAMWTKFFFGRMEIDELSTMILGENKEILLNKLLSINTYKNLFINDVV